MQVYINNLDEKIDLDTLKQIGKGNDGTLYINKDYVIKICHSTFMSSTKVQDFALAREESIRRGKDPRASRIVFPEHEVREISIKNLTLGSFAGYTQKYHLERKVGIRSLTTEEFRKGVKKIEEDIHTFFSNNAIAISDTNPKNLLVSEDGEIYLIDHDRCITRNTIRKRSDILDDSYFIHNDTTFAFLVSNALLLQAFSYMVLNDESLRMFLRFKQIEESKKTSLNNVLNELNGYRTIEEYAEDRSKVLKLEYLSDPYQ